MSAPDPIDVARSLFGAGALVAPALPEPVRTVVRVISAGLDLAAALRDRGHAPLASIATMTRTLEHFDARTRAGAEELDRLLDGILPPKPQDAPEVPPRAPTEPEGQPAAPADGGV